MFEVKTFFSSSQNRIKLLRWFGSITAIGLLVILFKQQGWAEIRGAFQEISMAFIYSEVGGIPLQTGLTVSILFRTLMLLGSLPGAVFVPGIVAGIKANK
jgi:hypothetical protein